MISIVEIYSECWFALILYSKTFKIIYAFTSLYGIFEVHVLEINIFRVQMKSFSFNFGQYETSAIKLL